MDFEQGHGVKKNYIIDIQNINSNCTSNIFID